MIARNQYLEIKDWVHRNARELELSLWKYFFEDQSKKLVIDALRVYQNEDGGFGNALEADNWNPNSTPITTNYALQILRKINFYDMTHPIYQGIWQYLNAEKDLLTYGWCFTVPSNNHFPHAPWWHYSEEQNKKEYFDVTAELSAFILEYGNSDMKIFKKAEMFTKKLMSVFMLEESSGDMGLEGYVILIETIEKLKYRNYDYVELYQLLSKRIHKSIEQDPLKWETYGVRPSNYIKKPTDRFYKENKKIVEMELNYLCSTIPQNDVWGIAWTWFDHMDKYSKNFSISENWWKSQRAVENVLMLKNFGKLEIPNLRKKEVEETVEQFLNSLNKLHTTELGIVRIKRNVSLDIEDVVKWCKDEIKNSDAEIIRTGKNWYITIHDYIITVNAFSYTIITVHKNKK